MDNLNHTQSDPQRKLSDYTLAVHSGVRRMAPLILTAALSLIAACGEKNVTRSYYPSGSLKTEAVTKDAVLNGRALMMSEAGIKLSEAEYRGGVLNGKSVAYFADGTVKASAEYQDGALHGSSVAYHSNGKKASEATFHAGALMGTVRGWTEQGLEKESGGK